MPRKARQFGYSGYLHVVAKGNGGQILFDEDRDHRHYLSLLERYSREMQVTVVAYCLMDNHVHLLIHDSQNAASEFMRRLNTSYAWYYNKRNERSGHVFQNRFFSEPIDNERYLLAVYRYILQNPLKAGLGRMSDYKWSSYHVEKRGDTFVDASVIRGCFKDETSHEAFLAEEEDMPCADYASRLSDRDALMILRRSAPAGNEKMIAALDRKARNEILMKLKGTGIAAKQIERLTGVGRGTVRRVWKEGERR